MIFFFFFNDTATTEIYTLSLHDALPISGTGAVWRWAGAGASPGSAQPGRRTETVPRLGEPSRSEEHTSELQSRQYLVCRLLLEKKINKMSTRCIVASDQHLEAHVTTTEK